MNKLTRSWLFLFFLTGGISSPAFAQPDSAWLKSQVNILAGPAMKGRGYLKNGGRKAARYLHRQFRKAGLAPLPGGSGYFQPFSMNINTFPRNPVLKINGKTLRPGVDYMVHSASSPVKLTTGEIKVVDLSSIKDSLAWEGIKQGFHGGEVFLLRHADTLLKYRHLSIRTLAGELPRGVFLFTLGSKLSWLANQDTVAATILYLADSLLTAPVKTLYVKVKARYVRGFRNRNIAGFIKGTAMPDSFLVFTAHYDHLGLMGSTLFPGANDNASGIAYLLGLAGYYARHPAPYSIAFIAFAGEEAGLVGSRYYAAHPAFPLMQIRFLINMDMMGDATNGITVINAPANEREYKLLEQINRKNGYLPAVMARSQTKNSDHYPFSEKGVPAVYIYTNGIKPFYHDTRDTAGELNFENADGVWNLLRDFLGAYMQQLP